MSLKPFVYWAQSETQVFLKVDLKQVYDPEIVVKEEEMEFKARGIGAQGGHTARTYHFVLEFFLPVEAKPPKVHITERQVNVSMNKKESGWWPRLLFQQHKVSWLKIDFDRWKSSDASDSGDDDYDAPGRTDSKGRFNSPEALQQRYPDVFRDLQLSELGFISEGKRKIYLFMYNLLMLVGFLYVLLVMQLKYASMGEAFIPDTYSTVGNAMKMLHLFMFLEVLHPLFGYTHSSTKAALLQVGSRNFILLAMLEAEPRMQEKPVVFYLFLIYCLIEVFRYPYYMLRVYDVNVSMVTWLRYTLWIPLYPAAFVCEGVVLLRNIPYFEETGKFTISLPNAYNVSFHFPSLLRILLLFVFFPVLYTLMQHMYQLRCKRLGIKQHKANRPKKHD